MYGSTILALVDSMRPFRYSTVLVGLLGSLGLGIAVAVVSSPVETPRCPESCAGVVYLWSERMPLSRAGIDPITAAAEAVGIELTLLESELLAAYAVGQSEPTGSQASVIDGRESAGRVFDQRLFDQLLASGALAHAPALVVHADGRVLGPAILGYKTSAAYASALRRRLSDAREWAGSAQDPDRAEAARPADRTQPASPGMEPLGGGLQTVTELEAVGRPGAYFRWVPGRQALAYESRGDIYLLDLSDGESREGPGYVDFIPSPGGRFFVTPAPRRSGMEFYGAREVFEAVEDGESGRVDPVFTDPAMRDQYPSVGILAQGDPAAGTGPADSGAPEASATVYRVLTSWFEGIRYRDYEVSGTADGDLEIRPVGPRVEPCRDRQLSIPIMSQDGLEVAARDESTGTTKIFRLLEDGRCEEVEDLGVQTGKVAWHWSGRLLAFARPPLRARIGPGGISGLRVPGSRSRDGAARADHLRAADGIFVYDREEGRMSRVEDSEDASSVVFPEFIGDDRLVYVVPGGSGEPTVFRIVEGIR